MTFSKNKILILIVVLIIILSFSLIWRFDIIINKTMLVFDCKSDYQYSLTNFGYQNDKTVGHAGDNDMYKDNAYMEILNCLSSKLKNNCSDSAQIADTILHAIRTDNLLKRRYIYEFNFKNLKIDTDTIIKYYRNFFKYDCSLLVNFDLYQKTKNEDYLRPARDSIENVKIYRSFYLKKVGVNENVPINIDFVINNGEDIFNPIMIQ